MKENQEKSRVGSILLTLLACLMLLGFAWAVPSGNVSDELTEAWEQEEESGEDEYDFL